MTIKITDEERAKNAEANALIAGFDMKQALLTATAVLIKIDTEDTIDLIASVLESICDIYTGSASTMMGGLLEREGVTVDDATDLISDTMQKAVLMKEIAQLLRKAAEPDEKNGPDGLFTPDWEHLNRAKEGLRTELTRRKNLADIAAKQRAARR